MRADPEPNESLWRVVSQGAKVAANPCGPKASGFFELERGVPRILFEEFEIFIGQWPWSFSAAGRSAPKKISVRGASQRLDLAALQLPVDLCKDGIEFTVLRIAGDLLVPSIGAELLEPSGEARELVTLQLGHLLLELLNAHGPNIRPLPISPQTVFSLSYSSAVSGKSRSGVPAA